MNNFTNKIGPYLFINGTLSFWTKWSILIQIPFKILMFGMYIYTTFQFILCLRILNPSKVNVIYSIIMQYI